MSRKRRKKNNELAGHHLLFYLANIGPARESRLTKDLKRDASAAIKECLQKGLIEQKDWKYHITDSGRRKLNRALTAAVFNSL